jgi:luciferase family oxidoreductase group 1
VEYPPGLAPSRVASEAMILSVLDQSPIRSGATAADAVAETIELARLADRLGFTRYWLAEHHSSNAFAGTAPEILIGSVANATRHLRVGSGGVMLRHYSPLKVAECFRMLETLHPGRIDLGVGRAPGATPRTTSALQAGPTAHSLEAFPEQLRLLESFLTDHLEKGHPFHGVHAMPSGPGLPDLWLLGSGGESALYAAEIGASFSYAHFSNPDGEAVMETYRRHFKPSARLAEPRGSICVSVICADTEEEAHRLVTPILLWGLRLLTGKGGAFPSPEEAQAFLPTLTDEDLLLIKARQDQAVIGAPEQVHQKLLALGRSYGVDEAVVVTITHDFEARKRSYELLAEAFELQRRAA